MTQSLPIDQMFVRSDARPVDDITVAGLAESIGDVGLINPIRVRGVDGRWEVLAGVHRLMACKSLGLADIECIVVADDDLHAELAMIDENLCRAELSPADRAKHTARRKAIYLELHPETAHGANKAPSGKFAHTEAESFAAETAKLSGRDESSVRRDIVRGEKIIDAALDVIRGTGLDTGTYLDKIKKLSPSEQVTAARRDLAYLRGKEREGRQKANSSKLQADVKARAAREVAEILSEHIPGEWWDGLKANLYAAGAKAIADAFTNITGQSIMDRRYGT